MASSAWLKSRGVIGKATVQLTSSGLAISGEEAGVFRIAPAQVRRIRTNWMSVKYGPYFLTRIWLEGVAGPLKLHARGYPVDAYAGVIRGFAEQVARIDGVTRLQRGSSMATALELAAPMLALLLAAIAIGIVALDGAAWWERMIPALVASPFAILGIWLAIRRWPRQVKDLAEFTSRVA